MSSSGLTVPTPSSSSKPISGRLSLLPPPASTVPVHVTRVLPSSPSMLNDHGGGMVPAGWPSRGFCRKRKKQASGSWYHGCLSRILPAAPCSAGSAFARLGCMKSTHSWMECGGMSSLSSGSCLAKGAVVSSRHLLMLRRAILPPVTEGTDPRKQPRGTLYYGWILMYALGITTIISYGTTQYLFGVLVVPIDATFHWGRASISGAYTLGLIIAGLLGVPIGHLVDRWGARLLMSSGSALGGLPLFGLAPLHAFLLRRPPEDLGLSPDGEPALPEQAKAPLPGATLSEALRTPVFWVLTASLSLVMLGSMVVFVHQVAFLIGRGYNAVLAATLAGMLGLVSLPGRYVLNVLSSRISAQKLLTLSVVGQAAGIVVLVQAPSLSWLILYVVVYGTSYGAFSPLRASVMADHFGRRAYGSITAVQGIPIAVCAGLGPLAAGWLYDMLHHYEVAFWLCAGAFLLAAVGMAVTPQPLNYDEDVGKAPGVVEKGSTR